MSAASTVSKLLQVSTRQPASGASGHLYTRDESAAAAATVAVMRVVSPIVWTPALHIQSLALRAWGMSRHFEVRIRLIHFFKPRSLGVYPHCGDDRTVGYVVRYLRRIRSHVAAPLGRQRQGGFSLTECVHHRWVSGSRTRAGQTGRV